VGVDSTVGETDEVCGRTRESAQRCVVAMVRERERIRRERRRSSLVDSHSRVIHSQPQMVGVCRSPCVCGVEFGTEEAG